MDQCLPMGFSISCTYFESFSTFLEWVVKQLNHSKGFKGLFYVVTDYREGVGEFWCSPSTREDGGASNGEKIVGIVIDSESMDCSLPEDKVQDLCLVVHKAKGATKIILCNLQSLSYNLCVNSILPIGSS